MTGTWTNDTVDIAIKIFRVYHDYGDCIRCKYMIYNKKNMISYEVKTGKVSKKVFEWGYRL